MAVAELELTPEIGYAAEETHCTGPASTGAFFANERADRAMFTRYFDHKPFLFRHALDQHPAFQLGALLCAAERLSKDPRTAGKSHFESGSPDRNAWFGARPEGQTIVDAIASIESGKNWVILKRIHEDPEYRAILMQLVPQLSQVAGVDIAKTYYDPTMTIFITSPGRVTPYHMDGETNFLAQIHGKKMVYIYDGADPSVLTTEQLEKYWTGNLPKIDYPENLPHGHWQYTLEPGNGVFNPAIFPHWLQNGDEVSVSVSMNFKRRHNTSIGALRFNHFARKFGLHPEVPGRNKGVDRAKEMFFGRAYEFAKTRLRN
jgi:hypothetical protein